MSRDTFRINNFDLIRLYAAAQVAFGHVLAFLDLRTQRLEDLPYGLSVLAWPLRLVGIADLGACDDALSRLPGVPIFFFVSGFLISRSFEANPQLREYGRNRLLRIYPALWVCFAVSLLLVAVSGYFGTVQVPLGTLAAWVIGQVTVVQFFNPEFMRGYGVGALNGSLWTIAVEIQFYVVVPLLYAVWARFKGLGSVRGLVTLIVALCAVNVAYNLWQPDDGEVMLRKFAGVTFLPWVYMFLVGVLVQRNFERVHRMLAGRFWLGAAIFIVCSVVSVDLMGFPMGNELDPLQFAGVCALVFASAYSRPRLAHTLLRKHDFSYGLYIYHMPVVNFLLQLGGAGKLWAAALALLASAILACLSWWGVERRALSRKRHPLNPLAKPTPQALQAS